MAQEEISRQNADDPESNRNFLTNLGEALCTQKNVDVKLAEILAAHLLVDVPAVDAVTKAKAAIVKLASDRASGGEPEAERG